jgi:hypothetical protein
MKRTLIKAVVLVGLVGLVVGIFWFAWPATASSNTIIEMAKRGSSETEMLKTVAESHPYRLKADDVIKLKTAGVPSTVIVAMLHDNGKK